MLASPSAMPGAATVHNLAHCARGVFRGSGELWRGLDAIERLPIPRGTAQQLDILGIGSALSRRGQPAPGPSRFGRSILRCCAFALGLFFVFFFALRFRGPPSSHPLERRFPRLEPCPTSILLSFEVAPTLVRQRAPRARPWPLHDSVARSPAQRRLEAARARRRSCGRALLLIWRALCTAFALESRWR